MAGAPGVLACCCGRAPEARRAACLLLLLLLRNPFPAGTAAPCSLCTCVPALYFLLLCVRMLPPPQEAAFRRFINGRSHLFNVGLARGSALPRVCLVPGDWALVGRRVTCLAAAS